MAAKINWHRYGTKLRHCHPMYCYRRRAQRGVCVSACVWHTGLPRRLDVNPHTHPIPTERPVEYPIKSTYPQNPEILHTRIPQFLHTSCLFARCIFNAFPLNLTSIEFSQTYGDSSQSPYPSHAHNHGNPHGCPVGTRTRVSPAKMTRLIKTRAGPKNRLLDGRAH